MAFPLTVLGAFAVIGAFCIGLRLAAGMGTKKALAHRALLRDATPDHYQGRQADFDEFGRPW